MFEYHGVMDELSSHPPARPSWGKPSGSAHVGSSRGTSSGGANSRGEAADLPLKAMSPGVVDFLFRQLVSGKPAEDADWRREGTLLAEQEPGAELARRLAESDVDALTPVELFEYVRAAQTLADWADMLRQRAVDSYCTQGRTRGASGRI